MKNWSFLLGSSVTQQVVGFIVLLRITRAFSPFEYGSYVYVIMAVNIAQSISSLGLRQIIVREVARTPWHWSPEVGDSRA